MSLPPGKTKWFDIVDSAVLALLYVERQKIYSADSAALL